MRDIFHVFGAFYLLTNLILVCKSQQISDSYQETIELTKQSGNESVCVHTNVNNCGGVINLESSSGIIQYKLNETYNLNEYCAWTILSSGSSLELNLTQEGFNDYNYQFDGITILNINQETGDLQLLERFKKKIDSSVQTFTTNSSTAIVIFASGNYYTGSGFELQIKVLGQRKLDVLFKAVHSFDTLANLDVNHYGIKKTEPLTTYKILTQSSIGNDTNFTVRTSVNPTRFVKLDGSCDYEETYKAYELVDGVHLLKLGEVPSFADKKNCPRDLEITRSRLWFTANTGFYILINRKILQTTWLASNREIRDKRVSTACGGLVVGTSGYLSYKPNDYYENGESCRWYVKSGTNWPRMHFTLEKDGLELCCDHLEIKKPGSSSSQFLSTMPSEERKSVRDLEIIANDPYSGVYVRFTSDRSVNGTGFRLMYATHPVGAM